jgi:hypothetical protein
MANEVRIVGTASVAPPSPCSSDGLTSSISLDACRRYTYRSTASRPVDAPSVAEDVAADISAVATIAFAAIRSLDRVPMIVQITGPGGTLQQTAFSDLFFFHSPGAPAASLKILGVGRIEYAVAGDPPLSGGILPSLSGWRTVDVATDLRALPTAGWVPGLTFARSRNPNKSYALDGANGAESVPDGRINSDNPELQWFLFG